MARYQFLEAIDQGGMGSVFKAVDRLTNETVALKKVLLSELSQSDEAEQGLEVDLKSALANEFRTLASLSHPNIISVLDYGFFSDGTPYYIMPYLERAQTLTEACEARSDEEKIGFLVNMLGALIYLHRRDLLHRDLKPDNILIHEGKLYLLDFGLATRQDEAGLAAGTWNYLAPEILSGQNATIASDLYSVGVIGYELFAGRVPFTTDQPDFVHRVQEVAVDFSGLSCTPAFSNVLAKLLHKDPLRRPKSAQSALIQMVEAAGIQAPVDVYTLQGNLRLPPFLGRSNLMSQIEQAANEAMAGSGKSWMLRGETGIGKSRVLDEIAKLGMVSGALVLRAEGHSDQLQPHTYSPWLTMVRQLLLHVIPSDHTASILKRYIPDIEQLIGSEVADPPPLDLANEQKQLNTLLLNLFRDYEGWILILIDDLDEFVSETEFYKQLNQMVSTLPLLLVATCSAESSGHAAVGLDELTFDHDVELQRFPLEVSAKILRRMVSADVDIGSLASFLHRESEGNPLFLIEMLAILKESYPDLSTFSAASRNGWPSTLKGSIQEIVDRRLSLLADTAWPLLTRLAIVKGRLDRDLIHRLGADIAPQRQLDQWLIVYTDAAVLRYNDGFWRFSHEQIRQAVLGSAQQSELVQHHRLAAQALEFRFAERPAYFAALAYHWFESGEVHKAREYAFQAGKLAKLNFANVEAIQQFSHVVAEAQTPLLPIQLRAYLERSEVYGLMGMRELQRQDLDLLKEYLSKRDDKCQSEFVADVAIQRAIFSETVGDLDAVILEAEQVMRLPNVAPRQSQLAHIVLGRAKLLQGRLGEARTYSEQSLQASIQAGTLDLQAESYRLIGLIEKHQQHLVAARKAWLSAIEVHRQLNNSRGVAIILNNLGALAEGEGDVATAIANWEQAQSIFVEVGDREGAARTAYNLALAYMRTGYYENAQAINRQALDTFNEIQHPLGQCLALVSDSLLHCKRNQYSLAFTAGQQALALSEQIGMPVYVGFATRALGHAQCAVSKLSEAASLYLQALNIWQELDHVGFIMGGYADLAATALKQNDLTLAHQYVQKIMLLLDDGVTLRDSSEPIEVANSCLDVFDLVQDSRKADLLNRAYEILQKDAEAITDSEMKQSYLEKVSANRTFLLRFKQAEMVEIGNIS